MINSVRGMTQQFIGLSSDEKSISGILIGSEFYEANTGESYVFDGSDWVQKKFPSIFGGSTEVKQDAILAILAQPVITQVSGTKAAAGDNEIVAAPAAGNCLVVSFLSSQLESDAVTTMIWKAGSLSAYRFYAPSIGAGIMKDFPPGREWKLPEATALNLNLSGANTCGYSVEYRTETIE